MGPALQVGMLLFDPKGPFEVGPDRPTVYAVVKVNRRSARIAYCVDGTSVEMTVATTVIPKAWTQINNRPLANSLAAALKERQESRDRAREADKAPDPVAGPAAGEPAGGGGVLDDR